MKVIQVKGNTLYCARLPVIVAAGARNTEAIKFEFDETWDGLTAFAVYLNTTDGVEYQSLLDAEAVSVLPWEVCKHTGELRIGVFGMDGEKTVRPTLWMSYGFVKEGVSTEDLVEPTEAHKSILEQMVTVQQSTAQCAEEGLRAATKAQEAAQAAQAAAEVAVQEATEITKGFATQAEEAFQQAAQCRNEAQIAMEQAEKASDESEKCRETISAAAEQVFQAKSAVDQLADQTSANAKQAQENADRSTQDAQAAQEARAGAEAAEGRVQAIVAGNEGYTKAETERLLRKRAPVIWSAVSGNAPIELSMCTEGGLENLTLTGYCLQEGVPTVDAPVELQCAGEYDEGAGKYIIPIIVSGRNLADYTKTVPSSEQHTIQLTENGVVWSGNQYFVIPISVLKGHRIWLSVESEFADTWNVVYEDGSADVNGPIKVGESLRTTGKAIKLLIYKKDSSVTGADMIFSNIMLSYWENQVYEPYLEPQEINLTSERLLTQWDSLRCQNGEWGWEYQSKEMVLTSQLGWMKFSASGVNQFYFACGDGLYEPECVNCFSSLLRGCVVSKRPYNYETVYLGLIGHGSSCIAVNMGDEWQDASVAQWKEWLEEHPVPVLYKTKSKEFFPLKQEEQDLLNNLTCCIGNTVITTLNNCAIQTMYPVETRLFLEKQLGELVDRIDALEAAIAKF